MASSDGELIEQLHDRARVIQERSEYLRRELEKAQSSGEIEEFYQNVFKAEQKDLEIRAARKYVPWVEFFRKYGLKGPEDYKEFLSTKGHQNAEIKEANEKLFKAEEELEKVLKKIDIELNKKLGDKEPTHISPDHIRLIEVESGKVVSLKKYLTSKYTLFIILRFYGCPICIQHLRDVQTYLLDFQHKHCSVVVVCHGSLEGGQKWRQQTGIHSLALLADEKSEFMNHLKFRRSVWNSERVHTQRVIAGAILNGHAAHIVNDPIHDLNQMGGDIILSHEGKVMYLHENISLTDRQDAKVILEAI